MARLDIPQSVSDAPEESQSTLDVVGKRLGFVPNVHRLLGLSPNALAGFMQLQTALNKTLDAATRDSVSLAVSQANGCRYCVGAHGYTAARFNGFSEGEIALAREGKSSDPRRQAAATFARRLIETRGQVSDDDLRAVRDAGYSDRNIVEVVALSAQFLLTNFLNNVADTEIDFPEPANLPERSL
ncbi:carboxymuconolactone decarboxylase family protein [Mycobacterium sp. HNNTM2301]|uniref:carboxymuconolactone decarboxylase family protein n=1 Tax=Mycobacterium hainanense TaxID=3289775 RepID=UPI0035A6CBF6